MNISQQQSAFQQYLIGSSLDEDFLATIAPIAQGDVRSRLNIYHHAYRARIIEVLSNQFPHLHKLLGQQKFANHVIKFIDQYPSTYRNMRWLGDKFSHYFHVTEPKKPIYGDMAHFEWSLGLAFDAEDEQVISIQNLSEIAPDAWGALKFKWHASVKLIHASSNVVAIWKALETETKVRNRFKHVSSAYLVWRKEMTSQFKSLTPIEAMATKFMLDGGTFGELCELLAEKLDGEDATEKSAFILADWLNQGMLVGIYN